MSRSFSQTNTSQLQFAKLTPFEMGIISKAYAADLIPMRAVKVLSKAE